MFSSIVIFLMTFSTLSQALAIGQPGRGPNEPQITGPGTGYKLNSIQETTSWDLLEDMYLYHNAIRFFHETRGIKFNRTLTDYARLKALIYAWYDGNVPEDNGDIKFGENFHYSPTREELNATEVMEDWYFGQESKWNYKDPQVTSETREFAQIVWNATDRFGCGQAVSRGKKGGTYTVCFYDPPLTPGLEKDNVFQAQYGEPESSTPTSSDSGNGQQQQESTSGPPSKEPSAPSPGQESPALLVKNLIAYNRAIDSPLAEFKSEDL